MISFPVAAGLSLLDTSLMNGMDLVWQFRKGTILGFHGWRNILFGWNKEDLRIFYLTPIIEELVHRCLFPTALMLMMNRCLQIDPEISEKMAILLSSLHFVFAHVNPESKGLEWFRCLTTIPITCLFVNQTSIVDLLNCKKANAEYSLLIILFAGYASLIIPNTIRFVKAMFSNDKTFKKYLVWNLYHSLPVMCILLSFVLFFDRNSRVVSGTTIFRTIPLHMICNFVPQLMIKTIRDFY